MLRPLALLAAGAIEAAVTVLTLRGQRIHPTRNVLVPDPDCDLNYVPAAPRPAAIDYAMTNSPGFGGHNSTLIVGRG